MAKRKREVAAAQEEQNEGKKAKRERQKASGLSKNPETIASQDMIQVKESAIQEVPSLLLDSITCFMQKRGFTRVSECIQIERESRNQPNGGRDHVGTFVDRSIPGLEEIWDEWLARWSIENPKAAKNIEPVPETKHKSLHVKNLPEGNGGLESETSSSSSDDSSDGAKKRLRHHVKAEINGKNSHLPLNIGEVSKQQKARRDVAVDPRKELDKEKGERLNGSTHAAPVGEGLVVNGMGQRVKPPLTTRKSMDADGVLEGEHPGLSESSSSDETSGSDAGAEEDAVNEDAGALNGGVSNKSLKKIMKEPAKPVTLSSISSSSASNSTSELQEEQAKSNRKKSGEATASAIAPIILESDADSESSDSDSSSDSFRRSKAVPVSKKSSMKKQKTKPESDSVNLIETPEHANGEIVRSKETEPAKEKQERKRSLSPFSTRALISPHPRLPPTPMVSSSNHDRGYISLSNFPNGSNAAFGHHKNKKQKLNTKKSSLREEKRAQKEAKQGKKGHGHKSKPSMIQQLKKAETEAIPKGEDPASYRLPEALHKQKKPSKPDWSGARERVVADARAAQEQAANPSISNGSTSSKPFERVSKDTPVDPKFASNAYKARKVAAQPEFDNVNGYTGPGGGGGGASEREDYGSKAHRDLIVTKGKGFTKEKNKKKRGSYRGGAIDTGGGGGIKFD